MKTYIFSITIFLLFSFSITSCDRKTQEDKLFIRTFDPDTISLIRNPYMGWTIYDDAAGPVANAREYWELQDTIARKYATTLYIRWRWSEFEPEEGKYAWEHDSNFQELVNGALERGLRLAFRIYVASQDNWNESTPAFVFDAGAKYYMEKGQQGDVRSPYPDDPVFQEKFENFIQAFAEKFDDPELVNYVDGYNLGWWGEGHHLRFLDENKKEETFSWIINLYGNEFKNVPLVITVDSQIGHDLELKYAINDNGYAVRRDGYASFWMPESQKKLLKNLFPKCFIVAECCYWQNITIERVNQIEQKYNWDSWAQYYSQVVDEALETHANYLDLRTPVEAVRWAGQANDEVKRFIKKGGYRIYPEKVSYPKSVSKKNQLTINHAWRSLGVGVLPNNNNKINYKYKIAFALLNQDSSLAQYWLSEDAEPSEWIDNTIQYTYDESFLLGDIDSGEYKLVCGIVDSRKDKKPSINLAIGDSESFSKDGWLIIEDIKILN